MGTLAVRLQAARIGGSARGPALIDGTAMQELSRLPADNSAVYAEDAELGDKPDLETKSDISGEYGNIALLLLLYTLQGVPMGLAAVLPLLLKELNVSYSDLATFSLNSYPFSLKLLWAPIVDTAFHPRFGRRKTWMVPAQLLIGTVMLCLSWSLDDLLYADKPKIKTLTALFFLLYFLCATQDIAVDGWALTMLRKENVGYAATCNSVGQTLGYALGFTGFMVLQQFGLASLPSFMRFWGCVFLLVTVAVAVAKTEQPEAHDENSSPDSIKDCYRRMFQMLGLRAMRALAALLLTWKVGFAIVETVAPLKFQEYGVRKEHMAYMTSVLMPVYLVLPILIARWTSGSRPLDLALRAYPWRVALVPVVVGLVYTTPTGISTTSVPWFFYTLLLLVSALGAVASQCMFVAQMAFFAKISDPAMGGTCMTLLNTVANLGGMWPPTVTMRLVDVTTCKGQSCMLQSDGFYVMAAVCFVCAVVWYFVGMQPMRRLQCLKPSDWRAT
mmetsp:Transcript_44250/g.87789  ORF Transcript_44250/g.87789 Transcript_44250/m.87789 type:complete len:501 (+) Transcript_44250:72-1574(+)